MRYKIGMKNMLESDIERCEELLKKDFIESKEFSDIKAKYEMEYPNFSNGFKNYAPSLTGVPVNQVENVRILKSKLEMLLIKLEDTTGNNYGNHSNDNKTIFNINNSNSNNNNNTASNQNYHVMSIDDIRKNINDNTYLGDEEKNMLNEKLSEIEELQKSKEGKAAKWNKAKKILAFILDKGADIAIMFIPQILKAIK